ncbi:sigma-70 family RNA polymerase sigma factor [Streptomyces tibetensis]|uniref:sigma-70 family RNA polymerase sigma factor n=1 Tax=Streptomyces tibetensis TaxID=2382123 RepID=UPI0033D9C16C
MTRPNDSEGLLLPTGAQQAFGLPSELLELYENLQPELRRTIQREAAGAGGRVDTDEILRGIWAEVVHAWPLILRSGIPADEYIWNIAAHALRDLPFSPSRSAAAAPAGAAHSGAPSRPSAEHNLPAVVRLVQELTARVVGHGETDTVDAESTFTELGVDSLTALELRDLLAEATGLSFGAAVAFAHPTPLSLARHVAQRLPHTRAPGDDTGPVPQFEEFYRRLQPKLHKYARHLLGPVCCQDADDVLQIVWIIVLGHWTRIQHMNHAQAYVYMIVRNEALRSRRAAARRHARTPFADEAQLAALAELVRQSQTGQVERVIDEQGVKQYITEHLAPRLSRQQLTILLMDMAGYETGTVAEALCIEQSTVRVQRHRIRTKLAASKPPPFL